MNLIPYNPVQGCNFKKPTAEKINKFREELEKVNKKVTVRLERGIDIFAGCGQLSGIAKNKN